MLNYRFIKNKKAELSYNLLFAFLVLPIALVFIYIQVQDISGIGEERKIGETQLQLLKLGQDQENILFYIDQAARNSFDPAFTLFTEAGGFNTQSECGEHKEYNVWQTKDKECYPDISKGFGKFFAKELDSYLEQYPEENIPTSNYRFSVQDNKVVGQALKDIQFDIGDIGTYRFTPSFSIEGDFTDFRNVVELAKEFYEICIKEENPEDCIEFKLIEGKLIDTWELKFEDNKALFDVSGQQGVIRFGLDFS